MPREQRVRGTHTRLLHMPYRAVRVSDHARTAHGIPDGVRLMPYNKPGVAAVDVQSLGCDAALPPGQQALIGGVRKMPSDRNELHPVLLPEQRVSQQLPGGRITQWRHS